MDEPKAKYGVDEARADLQAMLPDVVRAIRACLRPAPPRHAQVLLATAKEVLNRVGLPAVSASTISAPDGGAVRHSGKFIIELVEVKNEPRT